MSSQTTSTFICLLFNCVLRFVLVAAEDNFCTSEECKTQSARILEKIDDTVNPCDDFYNFACGGSIKNYKLPNNTHKHDEIDNIRTKVEKELNDMFYDDDDDDDEELDVLKLSKKLFRACMNEEAIKSRGLQPLTDILDLMGGWPVTKREESSLTWQETIEIGLENGLNVDFPVSFGIMRDYLAKKRTKRILRVSSAALSLDQKMYLEQQENVTFHVYHQHQIALAVRFGAERSKAEEEMFDVLQFEISLANISSLDQLNESSMPLTWPLMTYVTVNDLEEFSFMNWSSMISAILPIEDQLLDNETVAVDSVKYLRALEDLIDITPSKTIRNFIFWRIVDTYSSLLGIPKSYKGDTRPRALKCFDYARYDLPVSANALWVRKFFDPKTKPEVITVVKALKDEFKEILKTVEWLDEDTRRLALDKVSQMSAHVAYPDEFLDNELLIQHYINITVDETKFFEAMLELEKFQLYQHYKKIHEAIDLSNWLRFTYATMVNAFYFPMENSIRIPAAFLQGDIYNVKWTKESQMEYLNYATLGFTLGHEITHGFDNVGHEFDARGEWVDWWMANDTEKTFKNKCECLKDQYNNFTDPISGLNLNGSSTLMENIADHGGIKVSYRCYNKYLKDEPAKKLPGLDFSFKQLFWVLNAQVWCSSYDNETAKLQIKNLLHSLPQFRINGPMRNMRAFSDDFNCPKKSKMNPDVKCEVW